MITLRLAAVAFAAGLAGASIAQAQTAPPAPDASSGGHHWDSAGFREHGEARRAARLKALRDVLAIRPDQDAAFRAFAEAMKPPQRPADAMQGRRTGEFDEMTTPERLDLMQRRMQEWAAQKQEIFTRRATAIRAFYTALDPAQRKAFDALPLLRDEAPHGGWGRHDHGQFGGRAFGPPPQG